MKENVDEKRLNIVCKEAKAKSKYAVQCLRKGNS